MILFHRRDAEAQRKTRKDKRKTNFKFDFCSVFYSVSQRFGGENTL